MASGASTRSSVGTQPGLCGTCRHSKVIETRRGSTFRLCLRSINDPRYPRYPTLPVRSCPGYEPIAPADELPQTT